jgi:hypothetical protein
VGERYDADQGLSNRGRKRRAIGYDTRRPGRPGPFPEVSMRRLPLALLSGLVLLAAPGPRPAAAAPAASTPVLHVVLFTFTPDMKPADEAALVADAKRLLAAVPGVEEVRIGHKAWDDRDVHVKDYSMALSIRFKDKAACLAYQPDPKHQEFANKWRPKFASVRVIDFYSE